MAESLRIDKWLWHARFCKTRLIAQEKAVKGHIRLNGQRVEKASTAVRVGDVMTSDVRRCGPEDDITAAEHLMGTHQVHRLPVTNDDGTIIGMLSVSDVVRRAKRGIRPTKQTDTEEQCLDTLAAIRRPRPHPMTAERVAS